METLTAGNIWDIVLAVFFLLCIIRGYCSGLVLQAAHLAVVFLSVAAAKVLSNMAGVPFLSGVFFVIALFVFWQVVKLVKIVDFIPLVGTLDKLCGALAGFLIAFLLCFFLIGFLGDVISQKMWNEWGLSQKAIKETYLLRIFLCRGK